MKNRSRFQRGSLKCVTRKGGHKSWIFRWREKQADGTYRPRKCTVGALKDLPTERSAWLAVEALELNINTDITETARAPRTFGELASHYEKTEMADDSETLAFSTREGYKSYLDNWILPKWEEYRLSDFESLPGVHVENWLKTVPKQPGTKAKIRNLMSGICSHALRYGWMKIHPIKGKVRQSAKTVLKKVPLEEHELPLLYSELEQMYRTMLILDVPSGIRRGEILALQWQDFDFEKKTMDIKKSIWKQHVGPVKTDESEKVMPLTDEMIAELLAWRAETTYAKDTDWVFASSRMKGKQPLWPEAVMKNHFRPAAERAGITKTISWHVFRHTFSTLMIDSGEDVKTVQSLMRHANPRITMEVYSHAIDRKKRSAQAKIVEMVLPKKEAVAAGV